MVRVPDGTTQYGWGIDAERVNYSLHWLGLDTDNDRWAVYLYDGISSEQCIAWLLDAYVRTQV